MFDNSILLKKAKGLPERPGVYIMKDNNEIIIYIGKSKKLRNRVSSYFYNLKDRSTKIENLVTNVTDFEYVLCDNELDALLLENRMIKEHKPRYNSLLKNVNRYPYIVIGKKRGYYNISWTYELEEEFLHFFGPYNSRSSVETYIEMLRSTYNLKKCSEYRSSKCLEYHMGNCLAPCDGEISLNEYNKCFQYIIEHLEGRSEAPIIHANEKMMKYAQEMKFEKAGEMKSYIENSKNLIDQRNLMGSDEYRGKLTYVLPTVDGREKLYFLQDLNVIHSETVGEMEETFIKERWECISSQRFSEVAATSSKDLLDEKMIIYSFMKNSGKIFRGENYA